jgi:hypothetical protein
LLTIRELEAIDFGGTITDSPSHKLWNLSQ